MSSEQKFPPAVIVGIAIGIPSFIVALMSLWIAYLAFSRSQQGPPKTSELELSSLPPRNQHRQRWSSSHETRIPATGGIDLHSPLDHTQQPHAISQYGMEWPSIHRQHTRPVNGDHSYQPIGDIYPHRRHEGLQIFPNHNTRVPITSRYRQYYPSWNDNMP